MFDVNVKSYIRGRLQSDALDGQDGTLAVSQYSLQYNDDLRRELVVREQG
jgi:hypothetical protein